MGEHQQGRGAMDTFYTVIRGDTLFDIAQRFYGDGNKFPIIAQANGIADPDRIFPGQVLRIPDITSPDPGPGPDPHQPPDPSCSGYCGRRTC